MKYLLLCMVFLLTACSSEGMVVSHNQKPDYLTVFQAFQKSDLAQICDDFEDKLWDKPSEKNHQAMPYHVEMDMEIIDDSFANGSYTANLSCKADVTYSFSSTTFVHEEHELSAGILSFDY